MRIKGSMLEGAAGLGAPALGPQAEAFGLHPNNLPPFPHFFPSPCRPAALEGRRAVLGSLLAGVAALSLAGTPRAQAVELEDYRKARETGFDLIYEARDLNLTQAERDGLTQARTDLGATRKRLQQSEKSIDKDLEQWIRKNYWCVVH